MTERTTTHLSDEAVQNIISTVDYWYRRRDEREDALYMMRLWNIINEERGGDDAYEEAERPKIEW